MPPAAEFLFVCDQCFDSIVCSETALTITWQWKRYQGGTGESKWLLLLCPDCIPPAK